MADKARMISIVQAVQRGDEGAATELYTTFYNDIYSYIKNTVSDTELAADLTQNTFMEIFVTIGKLEEPAAFLSWSKQIAHHRCTAYFRKRREVLLDECGDETVFDSIEEDRQEFIPGETLDVKEFQAAVRAMVDALPQKQRSVILMRYYEERSVKEIAQLQNIREGTVKSRLDHGRKAIKKALQAYEKKHNVKLYSTGAVPVLLWMFKEFKISNGLSLTAQVTCETFTAAAAEQAAIAGGSAAGSGVVVGKVIAGITAVAVTAGCITATVLPAIEPVGPGISSEVTTPAAVDGLYLVLSSDGTYYEVRGIGNVAETEVTIPAEHNGIPVTSIAPYAFLNCTDITKVILPDTLTHIGEQAFYGCTALTDISIPGSVKELDAGAFYGCSALRNVAIAEGVTALGDASFWGCSSLTAISLPQSIQQIGNGAFFHCTELTQIDLPASLCSIDQFAFSGCNGLTRISIPKENEIYHSTGNCLIETESKTLVLGCKNSIIPADGSVTSIATGAFAEYAGLTAITIPAIVKTIQSNAFYLCGDLEDIRYSGTMSQWDTVAHSLSSDGIGDYSVHCTDGVIYRGNHQAMIPENLQGLRFWLSQDGTYYDVGPSDYPTAKVIVPDAYNGLPVRDVSFFACEDVEQVILPDSITTIADQAFAYCGALTEVSLPGALQTIENGAFENCAKLSAITIPVSVSYIGKKAFGYCSQLTDIYYLGTMQQWTALEKADGWDANTGAYSIHCLDGKIVKSNAPDVTPDGSEGLEYTLNKDGISYRVSSDVYCTDTHIVIPSKYNGLPVTAIESEAFYGNERITAITIPASVIDIEEHIFGENPNLKTIIIQEGNPVYRSAGNCIIETDTKTLIIGCNGSVIPTDGTVVRIANHAFYSCAMTAVSIPACITEIGYAAFAHCFDLVSVTLPEGVANLQGQAFGYCQSLTEITYAGTMAQWAAVEKETNWDYSTGSYTVHCSDGDIAKE